MGGAEVAGGTLGGVLLAEVTAEPIDLDALVALVHDDSAGAVVTFAGVVRDHDGGQQGVRWLDYSAHPTAGDVLAAVAAEIAAEQPRTRIAVAHRVGRLDIRDLALGCAVSSAHRAEAFAACAELVERIKQRVPIWKEQGFADGHTEWVASL